MSNKLKFEFDWDEVFDSIKKGVVSEISEEAIERILDIIKDDIEREIRNKSEFYSWEKDSIHKNIIKEVKEDLEKSVFDSIEHKVENLYKDKFNDEYFKNRIKENIEYIETNIIENVTNELTDIFASKLESNAEKIARDLVLGKMKLPKYETNRATLEQLEEDSRKLHALENYGVDNWRCYEDAMNSLKDEDDE